MVFLVGWCWRYGRARGVVASEVVVEVESCPNAKLSIKLAHSKHLLGASPLPSHAAGFAHRFSPSVGCITLRVLPLSTVTPHTSRLTLH